MVWRSDRFRGPIPVGQQLDGLGLYDGCLLTLHVGWVPHSLNILFLPSEDLLISSLGCVCILAVVYIKKVEL
jgi:hypothetical protein